jgi:uncharacterized membrane protein
MSQGTGQPPGGYGPPGGGTWPAGGVYQPPGTAPLPAGGPSAGSWSPSEAIGFGWKAVTGDFVGVALPLAAVTMAVAVVGGIIGGIFGVVQVVAQKALSGSGAPDPMVLAGINLGTSLVQNVISFSLQALVMGGIVDFSLQVARGKKPAFGVVFGGPRYFVPMLVGMLVLAIAIGFGLLLCLVPGVILALGCLLWSNIVVDRGVGGIDALKQSWELTKGHKGSLFVFTLLAGLIMLAGVLACCIGAVLVSMPLFSIATAYVYLKLQGEEPELG